MYGLSEFLACASSLSMLNLPICPPTYHLSPIHPPIDPTCLPVCPICSLHDMPTPFPTPQTSATTSPMHHLIQPPTIWYDANGPQHACTMHITPQTHHLSMLPTHHANLNMTPLSSLWSQPEACNDNDGTMITPFLQQDDNDDDPIVAVIITTMHPGHHFTPPLLHLTLALVCTPPQPLLNLWHNNDNSCCSAPPSPCPHLACDVTMTTWTMW